MKSAARSRLSTEQRREQLLRAGVELLSLRPVDDVSIEDIATAASVSKSLLYHYFPTKKAFLLAALERGQTELAERIRPDPDLEPMAQLEAGLDAFLVYVEEHATAYRAIFRGVGDHEMLAVLDRGREEQRQTLVGALSRWDHSPVSAVPSPAVETAIQAWQYFVEGAVLRWLEHQDLERDQLLALLRTGFYGSIWAAAAAEGPAKAPALNRPL